MRNFYNTSIFCMQSHTKRVTTASLWDLSHNTFDVVKLKIVYQLGYFKNTYYDNRDICSHNIALVPKGGQKYNVA